MSALDAKHEGRVDRRRRNRLFGLACLAPPIAVLTLFAVGEGLDGEAGWWGHLIQLGIGVALGAGAWFVPKVGGPVLITAGILGSGLMLGADQGWVSKLSVIAVVFAPVIVAGIFFGRAAAEGTSDRARR